LKKLPANNQAVTQEERLDFDDQFVILEDRFQPVKSKALWRREKDCREGGKGR